MRGLDLETGTWQMTQIRGDQSCREVQGSEKHAQGRFDGTGELERRSPSFKAGFRSATPVSFMVLQWLCSTVGFLSVALSCGLDQIQ